jgi:hypothetical protein
MNMTFNMLGLKRKGAGQSVLAVRK